LLSSGLIQKREVNLATLLFPELERIATGALGSSARALLYDSYGRAGIQDQRSATADQIVMALDVFEAAATHAFGQGRIGPVMVDLRAYTEQVLSGM
jgi:hypothetical protein